MNSIERSLVGMLLAALTAAHAADQFGHAARRIPRLPDGHPDLQGVWTNTTLTPFERPIELGEKAFYSEGEFAKEETAAERRMEDVYYPPTGVGTDNAAFFEKD